MPVERKRRGKKFRLRMTGRECQGGKERKFNRLFD